MPNNGNNGTTSMVGWVYFAGILMILSGISQAFLGISDLVNKKYLFVNSDKLVYATANSNAWGWVHLGIGALVVAAGFSLLHGSNWARLFAIFFMGLSFIVNLAFIGVFPIWSIIILVLDVVIIHALIVQGRSEA